MSKTLLYRLFGIGGIPEKLSTILEKARGFYAALIAIGVQPGSTTDANT